MREINYSNKEMADGHSSREDKYYARIWGTYWLAVLILTVWVMLQGIGDYLSTRSHARSALARIRREQHELQQQLAAIKRRGSNGHPRSK